MNLPVRNGGRFQLQQYTGLVLKEEYFPPAILQLSAIDGEKKTIHKQQKPA